MYTSGRTVKSKARRTSPIADATAAGRKLVTRHLKGRSGVTVTTDRAFAADLTERMRTTITFPEGTDVAALAAAIADLPRYHSMCWNSCSISYLTDLEG